MSTLDDLLLPNAIVPRARWQGRKQVLTEMSAVMAKALGLDARDVYEAVLEREDDEPLLIDMTLDFLVDQLADAMHAERKLRTAFNRDIGNKVLFIKDGRLLFLKGIKLKAIADRAAYFAKLRSRQDQPIVILAELPADEAFAIWKQHVLGDKPR